MTRGVNPLSSIPFEEAHEIDRGSHTRPMARVALGVGASLLAVWMCPMLLALSAKSSLRHDTFSYAIPDLGPVDPPTPYVRAA